MEDVFTRIYEKELWGDNKNSFYKGSSGSGSTMRSNKKYYIPFLQDFIVKNNINTVVDLGCGDFVCGNEIYRDLTVSYTGYDTYKKVIDYHILSNTDPKYTFKHLDFLNSKENIIGGDLCILKDVIQHWSLKNINMFLDYLCKSKKFKYILICNGHRQKEDNTDIKDGGYRPLSCKMLPLKTYNPVELYRYNYKEISCITLDVS